ncbi:MAG: flavodoxin domain-containing protein [Candidatus Omnitrophica bacterium]|nr:flavodoxin domain-containing protein [Candidatus Omnitrophota bacterium]
MRKVIIIYFSQTGNTKKLSTKIYEILKEKGLEVSLFELESKERRNFFRNCIDAIKGKIYYIEKMPSIENYEIVFIGSPVWAGKITPLVRSLIKESNFQNKKVFPFITYGSGLGRIRALKEFEKLIIEKGGEIIGELDVKGKKIDENLPKIKEEIEKCLKKL